MIKAWKPILLLIMLSILFIWIPFPTPSKLLLNTYPNLPAPIGKEKVLLTSAGQAIEGKIIENIADDLYLDNDFRPRALASDLYDYETIIMDIGYSSNALHKINREFEEEKTRMLTLLKEANATSKPVIITYISNAYRTDQHTETLLLQAIPYASYFIGVKEPYLSRNIKSQLEKTDIPVTFVEQLDDLATPLNAAFR
ncbi:DUF6305 family protein [Radiobacillus deserti]|uniref:DUF6305 domain-containing protein n=1 Tax=Radiobacillus deserti TaxID=2594883 RepID=A0A516KIN3_9BACI|nr:DUF6305 family protein [Radiobacillus deserti]QDP41231.1 hypothetical protein FN924_14190 [Radiobacillus deserti]